MRIADKQMNVKLQDVLLSAGYEPNQFRYIKSNASDMVFKQIKTNKLLTMLYCDLYFLVFKK